MSESEVEGGHLFQLYARYVGEPESKTDVYGYWFFLFGSIISFTGVLLFLLVLPRTPSAFFIIVKKLSITFSAAGLPLGLLGIVLLLPVQRWSIGVTILGGIVAEAGVGWFVVAFPDNWVGGSPDYSAQIIGVYSAGLAVIVAVTVLVPIFTGRKSLFFEQAYERSREYPEVVVGEALRGGLFTVYKDEDEWTWRLIEQEALASSVNSYLSRLETEDAVDNIKNKVREAGLLEIKHAAFRLYEAAEDTWQWVLMREDGSVVANSGEEFESRDVAADAVNDLKELGPEAEIIEIGEGGAFRFVKRGGRIHWQLVDEDRQVVGEGPSGQDNRSNAERAIERARDHATDAGVLAIELFGVELYETGGEWHWRMVDTDDNELAESEVGFGSRREVEERTYDLLETIPDAPVLDSAQPAYEIVPTEHGDWHWRLIDDNERALVRGHGEQGSREAARNGAGMLKNHAADAEVVSIEEASFEYYPAPDGWRWRLVTEDREMLAESTDPYGDRSAAADAIEEVRSMATDADLIEFENAAFQLYEHEGEWRWRLIDEDGNVMADSGEEHDSRESAAASMMTIKEQAPNADVLEVETAAFELFHDEDENWNWRLVDISGETVARGPEMLDSREEARQAMDRLVENAAESDARAMDDAVFQVYADDSDEWHFRLVTADGTIVADSEEVFTTRDEAVTAVESEVRDQADRAEIHVIESIALQIDARGERYTWRLLDTDREPLATGSRSYADRGAVVSLIEGLQTHAGDATVFELQGATFQLIEDEGEWHWRLIDAERTELMVSTATFESRADAEAAVEHVQSLIGEADIVDFEGAAFEVFEAEGNWRWRLIDETETVMASGAQDYGSRNDVEVGIEDIRNELDDASILEIEIAAFELTEDEGEWRWRLIDENGNPIAQSLTVYESRREAREAMDILKEFGPEALTQVAE